MHISKLNLHNYKIFSDTEILFDSHLTVLAGKNGIGKSTILGALAKLLSWPSRRIGNIKANGIAIDKYSDISYGKNESRISLVVENGNESFSWSLVATSKGKLEQGRSDLSEVNEWAFRIQQALSENESAVCVPLFVFYPVDRAIIDIPLRIKGAHLFQGINALDDNMLSQSRFRVFFEWFRNQEDLENEKRIINPSYRDKSLEAVRKALSILLPEYSNLTVRRSPLRMEMKKNGQTVRVEGLSDGEKCLIALVGDLARRLSMANACLEDPLKGLGIVLIDEIDLHLHPAWQRNVVKKLTEAFPNCQFIMSTHSPQILGDVPAGNILLLEHTNNGIEIRHPLRSLGLSSNEAIDELMGDSSGLMLSQNEDVNRDLQKIYRLIDEERYDAASRAIEMLQRRVSEIPSVIEARTYLESVR